MGNMVTEWNINANICKCRNETTKKMVKFEDEKQNKLSVALFIIAGN